MWVLFFYFFRRRPPPVSDHFVVHQGRSLTRELTVLGNGWIAKEGQVRERFEIIGMCFNLRGWIYYQGTWTLQEHLKRTELVLRNRKTLFSLEDLVTSQFKDKHLNWTINLLFEFSECAIVFLRKQSVNLHAFVPVSLKFCKYS